MKMARLVGSTGSLLLTLLVGTARASTLPRVDFAAGNKILALGILDVDFDYALSDRPSIGASVIPYPNTSIAWYDPLLSPLNASVRATYRAGELLGMPAGVTPSAGVGQTIISGGMTPSLNPFPGLPLLRFQYFSYVQPALNVAVPLTGGWTMRATLGPIIVTDPAHQAVFPIWPNVELARPLGERGELTLLGNGLIGWRGVF